MKIISIQDLCQDWRNVENVLSDGKELIVMRDGKPMAKLVPCTGEAKSQKRFDPAEHLKWQLEVFGGDKRVNWVEQTLFNERGD